MFTRPETRNQVYKIAHPIDWVRRNLFIVALVTLGTVFIGPGSSAIADLNSGLIAYYPFDGNANDNSPHGNHGVVHGATLAADRFGNPNGAYYFDGGGSYITLPPDVLNNLPRGTFLAWIRWDSYTGRGGSVPVVSKGTAALTDFMIGIGEDGSCGAHMGTPLYFNSKKPLIPLGTWVAIALSWNGVGWQLFVNGAPAGAVETDASPLYDNQNAVKIGRHDHISGPFFFQGAIDDVRIYNRALDWNEIQTLYQLEGKGSQSEPSNDRNRVLLARYVVLGVGILAFIGFTVVVVRLTIPRHRNQ